MTTDKTVNRVLRWWLAAGVCFFNTLVLLFCIFFILYACNAVPFEMSPSFSENAGFWFLFTLLLSWYYKEKLENMKLREEIKTLKRKLKEKEKEESIYS